MAATAGLHNALCVNPSEMHFGDLFGGEVGVLCGLASPAQPGKTYYSATQTGWSYGKRQGGGAEQNPEHAEYVLSRHRCVPKIASPEARTNRIYYGCTEPRVQGSGLLA